MSFLSPIFLAGLALLAVPWLIHRIRRPEREVVRFPSLMFVPDIKKEVIERRRIQHLLLMLLRMLLLLILAFAFSRPYFSRARAPVALPAAGLERHLLLLDVSGSMVLGRSFERAVKRAAALVDDLPTEAVIGLVTFDSSCILLVPLTLDGAPLVREALDRLRPGQSGTDLANALAFAEGLLSNPTESSPQPGHTTQYLHLISDFQRSTVAETDETWRLSSQINFRSYPINPDPKDLFAITDLAVRALDDATITVAAKVRNLSDLDMENLEVSLFIEDKPIESRKLSVQAGNATLVNFILKPHGDFWGRVQVGAEDDGDNQRHFVWRAPRRLKLLMVSDPNLTSQYPAPWLMGLAIGDQWERSNCSPGELQTCLTAINPDLVIFCGLKKPGPNLGRDLNQYLAKGGKALLALDSNLEPDPLNSYLLAPFGMKSSGPQWSDVAEDRFQVLSRVQLNSPIFQPFQGSRFNDFSLIHFNNFHKMTATGEARSIAWFHADQQDLPAMLTLGVGEGRLVLWAFDLDLKQTNLAKSIKFVPLLQETLSWLVGPQDQMQNFVPGQTYDLARWQEFGDITTPDGLNRGHSGSLVLTGAGLIRAGGRAVDAVNPIAAESLLETYSEKEFALKFTAGNHLMENRTHQNPADGDVLKVEFGSYFLPVLFLFLLLETLLAMKLSPRPRSAGGAK